MNNVDIVNAALKRINLLYGSNPFINNQLTEENFMSKRPTIASLTEEIKRQLARTEEQRKRADEAERALEVSHRHYGRTEEIVADRAKYKGLYEGFREAVLLLTESEEEKKYEIEQRLKFERDPRGYRPMS